MHRIPYGPLAALSLLLALGCGSAQPAAGPDRGGRRDARGPVAERRAHGVKSPNGTRNDPYYWLRDDTRKDPAVLAYLKAENDYSARMLAPSAKLQHTLYEEMVGRLKQDDTSVPVFNNGYTYWSKTVKGGQYHTSLRRKGRSDDSPVEVLLDRNAEAKGHDFYAASNLTVSPDNRLLAYAEDTVGRNQFVLKVVDLASGRRLADSVENITGALVWANDSKTLFYIEKNPTTLLGVRVRRHTLGATSDPIVYEEKDHAFYLSLGKTKSKSFIVISASSTISTESLLIDADQPTSAPRPFLPREPNHEYSIEHLDGRFVIRTNWQAKNFRVMEASETVPSDRSTWTDILPHRPEIFVHSVAVYNDFIAVSERSGGLRKIRIEPKNGTAFHVDAAEPAYTMYAYDMPEAAASKLRYSYTSMTTPSSVYEIDVATHKKTLLKREPVLGAFAPENYVTEYLHAPARDGHTMIPVTIVYRKGTARDGKAPLLQYGYGSYGASMDPRFSSARLSLLDRGFVWATAHIRGGQEMGRQWYEDGKLLRKKNTFTDFIDVTRFLVKERIAASSRVFAMGGSAGGLLMGAVANMAPELYRGIVAQVPFVDVVTTMLDTSIPLTTNEFDEWGDPREKAAYDYMLSYSPYDNVGAKAYPSMLVTTGLWDSQVQYFEPAKWVAKLRAKKTDDNPLLLHINMDAGHHGKSGRFSRYAEIARVYAFVLSTLASPDRR